MENRRLLLAALLSAVVLILWQQAMAPPPPPPVAPGEIEPSPEMTTPEEPVAPPESAGSELGLGEEAPEDGGTEGVPAETASLIDFSADVVEAEFEESVELATDQARARFSNHGAQLVSFILLNQTGPDGEPLELVRPRGVDPYPFSLVVGGDRSHRLNNALFQVRRLEDGAVRFRHRSERGAAEKIVSFTPEGLLKVDVTVEGKTDWSLLVGPGVRKLGEGEAQSRWVPRQASYRKGESSEQFRTGKLEEDVAVGAQGLRWVALEDNFFLNAVMPLSGVGSAVIRPVHQRAEVREGEPRFLPWSTEVDEENLADALLVLLQADGPRMEVLNYLGAKRYSRLTKLPYSLEETVRWGKYLGLLARPLYYGLEYIHGSVVANYGWAIVLVTILIKVLLFPLTIKGQMSMMKMQELNPKVQAIRAKYKGKLKDARGRPNAEAQRELNDKIMKIYRDAGVNPMGGCFPILLQMPVFFAFYRLLATAVELRGAPWIGWIHDLAAPDPIYVLPVLMGVTGIVMQKLTPSAPDPMQRRMLQMMPIAFAAFAFAFPSGLVLYWVTNNILSMIQQAIMTRLKKRRQAALSES